MERLIGTRTETTLHRALKFRYVGQNGQTEAVVAGFVADGISSRGEYIEIQTGSFAPLKEKVQKLALLGKVRIVYPVIINKYIEVFSVKGIREYRRKSPRKGTPWDIFNVLVYAVEIALLPRLTIELALIDVLETRVRDGKGSWRRKGVSMKDRAMTAFHERILLSKAADYLRFVPFEVSEVFTSKSFGEKTGIGVAMARKVLYVLSRLNVIEKIGKDRRNLLYRVVAFPKPAVREKLYK